MFHDVPSFPKYEWSHPDVFLYQKVLQPFTPHNVVPPIYRLVYTHELVPYIYSIRSLVFLEIDLHQLSFFDLGHSPSLPVPWFHPIPSPPGSVPSTAAPPSAFAPRAAPRSSPRPRRPRSRRRPGPRCGAGTWAFGRTFRWPGSWGCQPPFSGFIIYIYIL